jgi:hypothetical protein
VLHLIRNRDLAEATSIKVDHDEGSGRGIHRGLVGRSGVAVGEHSVVAGAKTQLEVVHG